jgi:DNA-binding transcriptional MerR regulator
MISSNLRHLPRLGLGEACQLYGFTPRALRFYEERGLVQAQRDRLNCRYFDGAARQRLAWIADLRKAQLSLPDILEILEAEDEGGCGRDLALEKLAARRRDLERQAANVEAVIGALTREPPTTRRLTSAA